MKECKRVFLLSIMTTIVFFSWVSLHAFIIEAEETLVWIVLGFIVIYGSLFGSLLTLDPSHLKRYYTFKYALVSTISKWLLFIVAVTFEPSEAYAFYFITGTFLVSLLSDIAMFITIKTRNEEEALNKVKTHSVKLSEYNLKVLNEELSAFKGIFILIVFTAVLVSNVEYLLDVFLHGLLLVFVVRVVINLYKHTQFNIHPGMVAGWFVLTYAGSLVVHYMVDTLDSAITGLVFAGIIYLPFIVYALRLINQKIKHSDACQLSQTNL